MLKIKFPSIYYKYFITHTSIKKRLIEIQCPNELLNNLLLNQNYNRYGENVYVSTHNKHLYMLSSLNI